jgi:hypothetical protein
MPWLSKEGLEKYAAAMSAAHPDRHPPGSVLKEMHFYPGPSWDGTEEQIINEMVKSAGTERRPDFKDSNKPSINLREWIDKLMKEHDERV